MTLTKQDLGSIKNLLKDELMPMKEDISDIQGGITGLKKEVTKLAVLQEDQADKI